MHPSKYLLILIVPALTMAGLWLGGWWTAMAPVFVFGLIPLLELRVRGEHVNPDADAEAERKTNRLYDWLLYLMVPVQYAVVATLVFQVARGAFGDWELAGAIFSTGICCGGLGINVAHELGHRINRFEQFLAKMLLLSSLYMHFFIEHNRGHHTHVATDEDPASARRGETVYAFWFRSTIGGFLSAWRMEWKLQSRRGRLPWGVANEMVRFVLIQTALVAAIGVFVGPKAMGAFVAAAVIGFLLLETVNYIEHYGLRRDKRERGYERVLPAHSWNSDHPIGRLLLFELTRHSDHHAHPKRPYPLLRSFPGAPQLPTGYPGMMVLSLVPPLFFAVMHPRLPQAMAPQPA